MRAKSALLSILALGLTALTACGGEAGPAAPDRPAITQKADLGAPLPDVMRQKGTLSIGVKCDYPPFGFIDEAGRNAGFEVDVAHRLAGYAFGDESKVQFTCVTGANRVPFLTTNRIDLIMATMNYTPERAQTIDFTSPYFAGGVKMLVPQDSSIAAWTDVKGQQVITIKGSTGSLWLTQCMPDVQQLPFEQTSEALTALTQKRAVAFAQDDTLLVDLAAKNKATKVVGDVKADSPWGMGVRKGDTAMAGWVNAAIKKMQTEDQFWVAFQAAVKDQKVRQEFSKVIPRPGNDLSYPTGSTIKC
jgi:polar amino acid transport system substrate-binding protein